MFFYSNFEISGKNGKNVKDFRSDRGPGKIDLELESQISRLEEARKRSKDDTISPFEIE